MILTILSKFGQLIGLGILTGPSIKEFQLTRGRGPEEPKNSRHLLLFSIKFYCLYRTHGGGGLKIPISAWRPSWFIFIHFRYLHHYIFKIYINGEEEYSVRNMMPRVYKNVQVHAGDKWYRPQPGFFRKLSFSSMRHFLCWSLPFYG